MCLFVTYESIKVKMELRTGFFIFIVESMPRPRRLVDCSFSLSCSRSFLHRFMASSLTTHTHTQKESRLSLAATKVISNPSKLHDSLHRRVHFVVVVVVVVVVRLLLFLFS